ncbi:hypothetical protein GCM10023196_053900 [Actinoallomurus vinaceus]|uniref:HTH cro/C1-type domain-containing protein n=1 Tax=Actinoallomurus vinaceus TaxID=1080074 RepID=A0ABP8UGN5_9ACTN
MAMENTISARGRGERHHEPRRTLDSDTAAMLRRYRQARRWSYRRASKETGVAYGYLAELEAARRAPSTVVAETLIRAYRLNPADAGALRSEALSGVGRDWRPGRGVSASDFPSDATIPHGA